MRYSPFPRSAFTLALLAAFALSACANEEPAEPEMTPEAPVEAPMPELIESDVAASDSVLIDVMQQEPYGAFLTDAEGRALYLFTADTQGESSACYDDCAAAWPPLLAAGTPTAADPALDAAMLGTLERRDGAMQVTYNGWPLYYYQPDQASGQVTGQDVHGFGGEWYLVSPQGEQIEAEAEGSAS